MYQRFEQLFYDQGAERILRNEISKTFVSRHDFDTNYQELYKAKGGKYYSVTRIDPAPGGYGEEFMYIKEVYALNIDENGKSYEENSLIKAKAAWELSHNWVLADDSGLCIDALNGNPGIYSARYKGLKTTYIVSV